MPTRKYSDLPADATVIQDGGYSDLPPRATVVSAGNQQPTTTASNINNIPDQQPQSVLGSMWQGLTQPEQPGQYQRTGIASIDNALTTVHNVGGRAIQTGASFFTHPYKTAVGLINSLPSVDPLTGRVNTGPLPPRVDQFKQDWQQSPRSALENAAGDVIGTVEGGRVAEGAMGGVKASPSLGSKVNNMVPPTLRTGVGNAIAKPVANVLAKGIGGTTERVGNVIQGAAATPESRAAGVARYATRNEAPEAMLNRALQPSVDNADFAGDLSTSLPSIKGKFVPNSGVAGIRDAANAVNDGAQTQYSKWLNPHENVPVNMAPVEAAQNASIPAVARLENPGLESKTAEVAARYNPGGPRTVTSPILDQFGKPTTTTVAGKPMTLGQADVLRVGNNQKLQGLYDAAQGNRYAAMANPETARTFAAGNALRDVTYKGLSDASGVPESQIRANQDLFGASKNVGEVASNRALVLGKKAPASPLDIHTGLAVASGHPVPALMLKGATSLFKAAKDPDALANAAIDKLNSPNAITFQPKANLFAKSAAATGRGISNLGRGITSAPPAISPYAAKLPAGAIVYAANPPKVNTPASSLWAIPKKK